MKASRVYLGPEVRGTRPVLVTFESFKDRDEVLRKVSDRWEELVWLIEFYPGEATEESKRSC